MQLFKSCSKHTCSPRTQASRKKRAAICICMLPVWTNSREVSPHQSLQSQRWLCAKHKMTNDEHGGPIQHRPCSTIDLSRFIHGRRPELIRQLCSSERLTSRPLHQTEKTIVLATNAHYHTKIPQNGDV